MKTPLYIMGMSQGIQHCFFETQTFVLASTVSALTSDETTQISGKDLS